MKGGIFSGKAISVDPGKVYFGERLHGFLPWPVVVFARSLEFSSGAPIIKNREGDSTHCPQGGTGYLPVSMSLSSGFGAGAGWAGGSPSGAGSAGGRGEGASEDPGANGAEGGAGWPGAGGAGAKGSEGAAGAAGGFATGT